WKGKGNHLSLLSLLRTSAGKMDMERQRARRALLCPFGDEEVKPGHVKATLAAVHTFIAG
ncbi:MAG TPA: hypothetical protein VLD66_10640, partial [Methyloceanibacter sp.]|nr:hypothetical protein [Methyloceanibacter sp.]